MTLRRAMSPLVATVLLIAFAVSLGALVMSFGSTYYEDERFSSADAEQQCAVVDLALLHVRDQPQLCASDGTLSFVLVNRANIALAGIQMWIVADTILVKDVLNTTLQAGQPFEGRVTYDMGAHGKVRQVQFIPRVRVPGSEERVFCFEQAVKVDDVRDC